MKLRPAYKERIIAAYRDEKTSIISLAAQYGVTRMAIYKVIRAAGVDTSLQAARITVTCAGCGGTMEVLRCRYRVAKNFYHNRICFGLGSSKARQDFQEQADLQAAERGQTPLSTDTYRKRLKRVKEILNRYYFPLSYGNEIHFVDGNVSNNHPKNLRVFKDRVQLLRHIRGFDAECIWDGSKVTPIEIPVTRNYSRLFPLIQSPYKKPGKVLVH